MNILIILRKMNKSAGKALRYAEGFSLSKAEYAEEASEVGFYVYEENNRQI